MVLLTVAPRDSGVVADTLDHFYQQYLVLLTTAPRNSGVVADTLDHFY